jgi:riboflavin kinase/FMN adenylyltransferase
VRILREIDHLPSELRGGAVTIGNFDGVHLGHAKIIEQLKAEAQRLGGPAIVFTFDPHPVRLLRPHAAPPPLTWTERKAELLEKLNIDAMIAYPTDEALLALSPRDFFEQILCQRLDVRAMVEGPNFYFGHDRKGDVQLLARLCSEKGIAMSVVEPMQIDGDIVSSSRVRDCVRRGEVAAARRMLTEPYRIRGLVTHGSARGSRIGFPTANIEAIDTLLPAQGVYAGRAFVAGTRWPAAVNIGPNPTFGEHALKVEAHLIGFADSLYGKPLEVDFLERLRDIRPFASVEELKDQLRRDVEAARKMAF